MTEIILGIALAVLINTAVLLVGICSGLEHSKKRDITLDKVEVIRCEKCKYWDEETKEKITYSSNDSTLVDFCECTYWSDYVTCRMTRYNDYCSLGEKKEENARL